MRQFNEWRTYWELEPWGEEREDMRNAHVVATLLNIFARKRHPSPWKMAEVLLHFGGDEEVEAAKADPVAAREKIRRTMELLMLIFNKPKDEPASGTSRKVESKAPAIPPRRNQAEPAKRKTPATSSGSERKGRR
jgi:hypothetical protein